MARTRKNRHRATSEDKSGDADGNGTKQGKQKTIIRTQARIPNRHKQKEMGTNEGEAEKQRYYTCANCKKSFGTTTGETNHLKHTPERKKYHKREIRKSTPRLQQKFQKPERTQRK